MKLPNPIGGFMAGEEGGSDSGWLGVLGAGAVAGLLGYKGQEDTNETNLALGREQMAFQERMSGSAYQRAMLDMQKAGLNPMLASQVGGATSPAGAMPQVQNKVAAGASSAVQAASTVQAAQQIVASKAQTEQMNAQTEKIKSETMEKNLNTSVRQWQLEKLKGESKGTAYDAARKEAEFDAANAGRGKTQTGFEADVAKRKAEARLRQLEIPGAQAEADFFNDGTGSANPYIRQLMQIFQGLASAARAAGR